MINLIVLQIGSFVDGSVSAGDRNSAFIYLDVPSINTVLGGPQLLRTVLVKTTQLIAEGETLLVYYGRGYFDLASPAVLSAWKDKGSCGDSGRNDDFKPLQSPYVGPVKGPELSRSC